MTRSRFWKMILKSFPQNYNAFSFDELLTCDTSATRKMSFMKNLDSKDPEIDNSLCNSTNNFNLFTTRGSNFVILFLYLDILDSK